MIASTVTVDRIDSLADPRIVPFRAVGDPELLQMGGLFVAEGRLVVRRVIEDGRFAIRSLLVNEAALRDLGPLVEMLDSRASIYVCETPAFLGITGFNIHRGCLALVERPAARSPADLLARAPLVVVLEAVTNPDNVGGVFRNAAAFDAGAVILSPTCCDPLYRKAIRTSMGATLRVPFARAGEWPGALSAIREAGFRLVAMTPRQPSVAIDDWRAARAGAKRVDKIALLVGTEGAGLSAEAESMADVRARIPIADGVDSLNLAVAVGIALHALRT